jgi:MoaA/NifB/PqqE/SkfB family radical SAM enzyme
MIEKIIQRLSGRKLSNKRKSRPFSAWQIELTTRCPLQCKMCIRMEEKGWQYQDMNFDDFKKIVPYLNQVENVVLEGWGESLLSEHLEDCVRLVKGEGAQVGFVTSAKGLTKNRVSDLIDAGLDFVGFSIAGTEPETHAAIRVNSRLSEILDAVRFFGEEKVRRKTTRPAMHLIYLMVKENIREVPSVPLFAKNLGIDEVILINICHTINKWQEQQRIFLWEKDENEFEKTVKQAEANARKLRVRLKRPGLSAGNPPVCSENPLKNLYISAGGDVSPCVYLYPSLDSPFRRIFCGKEHWIEKVSFGNIFRRPFHEIWNGSEYEAFRKRFSDREKGFRELYFSLFNNPKLKKPEDSKLPEPPDPCKTCHKILGV